MTLHQLRDFLTTLFHAPKSSLENRRWVHKSGPRSFVSISYGELGQYEGHWVQDETTGDEGFLDEHEDLFWVYDEDQCFWMKYPFQGRSLRKGFRSDKSKGGKGKQGKSKGKGAMARRLEEIEDEEIEDDALLTDKKKRKRRPQAKKKGKPQPAESAAHEAEAAVDDDGFAYSAISFPYDMISSNKEWCLKGNKGVQEEVEDGTSMILDTGCTKAMCSRHAYLLMREGLSEGQVELLPDSSTLNFANGQKALAREKCRIWFSYEPPLWTDFSIIDEGKVPFLTSLPQMKNLGVSLDLRGTPERILFHTGFLKGQGVPLHRNRAGHLTLDVMEICRKATASAHKGRQLQAASSFPATADEPSEAPSQSAPPPIAAEPAVPPPAVEKKYRLPSGQRMPATDLYKRADQRAAIRRQPAEVKGQEEKGAEPEAAVPPPVPAEVPVEGAPLGETSKGKQVWKGGQSVYRLMVVHVNHAVARTACRSCRINFAELLILSARFQVDLMGGDFNAFSYRYFRSGSQQIAASLQDSSLAVVLRRFDKGINAQHRGIYDNHPEYGTVLHCTSSAATST